MSFLITIGFLIGSTLMYSSPLILVAIGALFSEKSGIINIGLEGMMYFGCFSAAAVAVITGNPWLALVIAALSGGVFGLLHGYACIMRNANQVVSGIAINFLAPGLALYLSRLLFDGATMTPTIANKLPKLFTGIDSKTEFGELLNLIFSQYVVVYLAFAVVIITIIIMNRTKLGLRIKAVGEHPIAAATVGINVLRIRFFSVFISGALAGIGGACFSLAIVSNFRQGLISGQGYIALAAMIFGRWKPKSTMFACLLFGFTKSLQIFIGGPSVPFEISVDILSLLPYVVTIAVLVLFAKESAAPKAIGKPYNLDSR
ncbi:MAG: ABC transporter permease [Vallitalea sp.]|jgi:simple sugar transport system permease protein|nr:ABC transporter permease [Vallitalea sp.]